MTTRARAKAAVVAAIAEVRPFIAKGSAVIVGDGAVVADLRKHYAATGTGHPGGGAGERSRWSDDEKKAHALLSEKYRRLGMPPTKAEREAHEDVKYAKGNLKGGVCELMSREAESAKGHGLDDLSERMGEHAYNIAEQEGMQMPEGEANRRADEIISGLRNGTGDSAEPANADAIASRIIANRRKGR